MWYTSHWQSFSSHWNGSSSLIVLLHSQHNSPCKWQLFSLLDHTLRPPLLVQEARILCIIPLLCSHLIRSRLLLISPSTNGLSFSSCETSTGWSWHMPPSTLDPNLGHDLYDRLPSSLLSLSSISHNSHFLSSTSSPYLLARYLGQPNLPTLLFLAEPPTPLNWAHSSPPPQLSFSYLW